MSIELNAGGNVSTAAPSPLYIWLGLSTMWSPHGNTWLAHVKDEQGAVGWGLLVELGESNFGGELLAHQQNYYSKRSAGISSNKKKRNKSPHQSPADN